jgi:hypothetical protein
MDIKNIWTIQTFNTEQENALKAFVKALKMKLINEQKEYNLTDEQLNIAEERRINRLAGKSESVSWDEAKKNIRNYK